MAASNRRRGAEVFTAEVRRGLIDAGWTVAAVALTRADDVETVDLASISDVSPDSASRFNRRIHHALRSRLDETRPDVLVAMGGPTLRYVAMARSRCIVIYVAIGEPRFWIKSAFSRILNRLLLSRVDHIIAVSQATADQLKELNPGLGPRISVVHPGVDDSFFEVDAHPGQGRRALFLGSLSNEKDPYLALEGVTASEGWELRFVGDGPLRAGITETIRSRGLEDRVRLTGLVGDVKPYLAATDVLLLTSQTEGLPGVVLESAAAGVPAVAVNVGGLADAVLDGVTGVLVARDPQSIAGALDDLARNPERLAAMGKAARTRACEEFQLSASVDRFARILEAVAE